MKPVLDCDGALCRLSGETTFCQLDELAADLLTHASREETLQLDLKQVTDCDSAFAALLVACLQVKKQQNHSLLLLDSPEKLRSLLTVYGLEQSGFQFS